MPADYALYQEMAAFVRERLPAVPETAVILGSSLDAFAGKLQDPVEIPYGEIPHFLRSTAPGHAGKLVFGALGEKNVLCMCGRFHRYEGYAFAELTIPVRLFKLLGVGQTVLTNAAGAVNADYRVGDVMLLSDHIKLTAESPLIGPNIPEFGPRFFDVCDMYTARLRNIAKRVAESFPVRVHEGVYMYFAGPQFETPAEIRMARILGADAVGMSTVTEALTAAHCGMPLLAMSVITNMAAGVIPDRKLSGEEVSAAAAQTGDAFADYLAAVVAALN